MDAQKDLQLTAPDQGGLHIASVAAVDTTAPVKLVVQSQDYGGSAILTAKAVIIGPNIMGGKVTVPFNVVALDPITNQVTKEDVRPPSCVGAADFAKHPFASLPVDQDCNGIADDWESKHGGPFPDPTADVDPGYSGVLGADTPSAYQGDGFAVFDEYRGFHMLDAWGNTVWHDTDPRVQDLFYWDPNSLIQQSPFDPNPNRLANIFGVQTGSFIALHEVSAKQAQAKDPDDPTQPVNPLNWNSPFIESLLGPQGFAVVYIQANLNTGTGAKAEPTLGKSCPLSSANSPYYPSCFRNDGQFPIRIDPNAIQTEATSVLQAGADTTQYASALFDQVVAHETGHKLTLPHHTRVATPSPLRSAKNLDQDLPFGSFFQRNTWRLAIEEVVYKLLAANGFKPSTRLEDYPPRGCGGLSYQRPNGAPASSDLSAKQKADYAQAPQWPIWYDLGNDESRMMSQIGILSQDGTIMSHTPRLDYTTDGQWHFLDADLAGMCLLPSGCGTQPPVEPTCQ